MSVTREQRAAWRERLKELLRDVQGHSCETTDFRPIVKELLDALDSHDTLCGMPECGKCEHNVIRARCDAATPGRWNVVHSGHVEIWAERQQLLDDDVHVADIYDFSYGKQNQCHEANAEFIAHAREDVPVLLDAFAHMTRERDEWRRGLISVTANMMGPGPTEQTAEAHTHYAFAQDGRLNSERTEALQHIPKCATCGKPATCLGAYKGSTVAQYACDDCCGHGCEDGWCVALDRLPNEITDLRDEYVCATERAEKAERELAEWRQDIEDSHAVDAAMAKLDTALDLDGQLSRALAERDEIVEVLREHCAACSHRQPVPCMRSPGTCHTGAVLRSADERAKAVQPCSDHSSGWPDRCGDCAEFGTCPTIAADHERAKGEGGG